MHSEITTPQTATFLRVSWFGKTSRPISSRRLTRFGCERNEEGERIKVDSPAPRVRKCQDQMSASASSCPSVSARASSIAAILGPTKTLSICCFSRFHVPGPDGFTLFHIDEARSSDVLKEFLGETFSGVVGCDYHSAYRKFLKDLGAKMQFCWAHLIRDAKFLTTLRDRATRGYGERLLTAIKRLFHVWHQRDVMRPDRWKQSADRARREVLKVATRPPSRREAQNIAKRFRKHGEHYFRFLDTPSVEPRTRHGSNFRSS